MKMIHVNSGLVIAALLAASLLTAPAHAADPAQAHNTTPTPVTGAVVYDANGGVGGETVRNVAEGTKPAFPRVTRPGYAKKGWFTARYGGTEVTKKTPVDFKGRGSVTYYAQWTASKLMLKFDPDKGKLPAGTPKFKEVVVDGLYGKLPVPTRSGHRFLGWYSGSTKITSDMRVTKTRSHTAKAKWLKKGSGSTITTTEYKRLAKGLSTDDAKYTVGGVGFSAKLKMKGHIFIVYLWNAPTAKAKGALAVFMDDALIRKNSGKYKYLADKLEEWLYEEYYDWY
jgi:uncharacterized repeat protein (TIGR02543 family)